MEIGQKIKKIRELKNFTQEHMAQRLNISQPTYSRYEKEDGDLTITVLRSISEVLEVRIEDLLSFDEKNIFNNYGTANQTYLSVQNLYSMSNYERELFMKTIKLLEDKIISLETKLN